MTGKPIFDYPAEREAPDGEGCPICGIAIDGIVLDRNTPDGIHCSPECLEWFDRCLRCHRGPTWCECEAGVLTDRDAIYTVLRFDHVGLSLVMVYATTDLRDAFTVANDKTFDPTAIRPNRARRSIIETWLEGRVVRCWWISQHAYYESRNTEQRRSAENQIKRFPRPYVPPQKDRLEQLIELAEHYMNEADRERKRH